MKVPNPSLSNWKGALVLILGVAIAIAVLSSTNVGQQLQASLNGVAAKIPA